MFGMGRNAKKKEAIRQGKRDAAEVAKESAAGSEQGSTNAEDSEFFQKYPLFQMKLAQRADSNGLDYCMYCEVEVPLHLNNLREHYSCSRHKNNEAIYHLLPVFENYGMGWQEGSNKFWCDDCSVELEAKSKTLIKHIQSHGKVEKAITSGVEGDFGDERAVIQLFKMKLWKTDLEDSNPGLNLQLDAYEKLQPPFILREDSPSQPFIASVRKNVFSVSDLSLMERVASFLEKKGDSVCRAENKEGTSMKAFGMRRAMGDTGWYKHKKTFLYKLAEELASFISERLEAQYPAIFVHLKKIVEAESLGAHVTIGNSPFTSFAVTRGYNVRTHLDQDDYDLGFILWLHEGAAREGPKCSLFAFPEYEVSFIPAHGDVLCLRAGQVQHCTRALKKSSQLGMAFFQKASLMRQVRKLESLGAGGVIVDVEDKKGKTPKKTFYEKKCEFEDRKRIYARELAAGTYTLSDF